MLLAELLFYLAESISVKQDESGPEGRVGTADLLDMVLGIVEGGVLVLTCCKVGVESCHQLVGRPVVHFPQTHQKGLCAGFLEASLQAEHTFAGYFAQSGLTC